jgi:hypothetical protein
LWYNKEEENNTFSWLLIEIKATRIMTDLLIYRLASVICAPKALSTRKVHWR